uniref:Uncharacterized protein n=1 Tax=Ditylenchus dipsaci TaxID=166011 RepID=A0A915DAS0_9BILA
MTTSKKAPLFSHSLHSPLLSEERNICLKNKGLFSSSLSLIIKVAMRLLLGALLLLIAGIKCGKYEDAKELEAQRFVNFEVSFAKRLAPFGELFASALQVGLEEDLLGDLLTLTTGIDDNVKDLTRQQEYIFHSTIFQDLKRDYELHVAKPIGFFLRQIGFMSERRMNVSQAVIDGFTHECTTANSPLEIAIVRAATDSKKCGKPIMHNSSDQLFDLFHSTSFHDYTPLKAEEEHLFNQYFALLSFWLANRPAKLFSLKSFGVNHKKKKTKLALLEFLMEKFGIDKTGTAETECLPKAAFLAHRYKRDSIQHIADLLMEHVTALEYATVFCANISNYNDPDGANAYVRKVGKELEPVQVFIANWFEALLESTWPKKESFLIRDAINDFSKAPTCQSPIRPTMNCCSMCITK